MGISIIVAHDLSRGIGFEGRIPWDLKEDLLRFKSLTVNKCVVMGRKTFESIGKPLPNRFNIVITSSPKKFHDKYSECPWYRDGVMPVSSPELALIVAKNRGLSDIFIIGGSGVYEMFIPMASDMYITVVYDHYEADTYFPEYAYKEWRVVSKEEVLSPEEQDIPDYTFYRLTRNNVSRTRKIANFIIDKISGLF